MKRRLPQVDRGTLELTSTPPRQHRLGSGRNLGYDLRGDPQGQPVFWFHGSPSGRLEGVLLEQFGREEKLCFVVSDRPGLGSSEEDPTWTMQSYAADVVALADGLGIDRFSVAGGSGGGPFVLAMAAFAGSRIDRAVSLACAGAFELEGTRSSVGWVDRVARWAVRQQLGLVHAYFSVLALLTRIPESIARWGGQAVAPGRQGDMAVLLQRTLRESLRYGRGPLVKDTQVLHEDWGFSLEEIDITVDLVNGTRDEFIPSAYGEALAAQLPKVRQHRAEGDDHFRTIFDLERLACLLKGK